MGIYILNLINLNYLFDFLLILREKIIKRYKKKYPDQEYVEGDK